MTPYDQLVLEKAASIIASRTQRTPLVKEALFGNLLGGKTRALRKRMQKATQSYDERARVLKEEIDRLISEGKQSSFFGRRRFDKTQDRLTRANEAYMKTRESLGRDLSKARKQQGKSILTTGGVGTAGIIGVPKYLESRQPGSASPSYYSSGYGMG